MGGDMRDLTDKQKAILEWIIVFTRENHMPPTVREIAREFSISSAGVFGHLKALQNKGHIERGALGARSLRIKQFQMHENRFAEEIPVVGRIAAGTPLFAVENVDGFIAVDPGLLRGQGGKFFALQVKGDSMIDAGILEGDHVIVHQQKTADNGDIVVALLGDDATLKRFYHEGKRVRLQPENKRLKPIYATDVLIQGVVRGVIRKM